MVSREQTFSAILVRELNSQSCISGTITEVDSNDHMVDTVGMGYTERRKINEKIITEKVSYREGFRTMIESVHRPFAEMEALVRKGERTHSLQTDPPLTFFPSAMWNRRPSRPWLQRISLVCKAARYPHHRCFKWNGTHHSKHLFKLDW